MPTLFCSHTWTWSVGQRTRGVRPDEVGINDLVPREGLPVLMCLCEEFTRCDPAI